jgi:signal recognition particle receptor subunit beta
MSFVNYHTKEINCKIVYYGPGLGGKTTNLQHIYLKTSGQNKGKIVSLNSENERTIFFDFLPLNLGKIRDFNTRFHLYTVPGQVFYESSRKLILRGVDGLIFVADSQVEKMDANHESLQGLKKNLSEQGYNILKIPFVMQWNKRDLPNIAPIVDMETQFNPQMVPSFGSVACSGEGVFETLKSVSKMVLLNIRGSFQRESEKRF